MILNLLNFYKMAYSPPKPKSRIFISHEAKVIWQRVGKCASCSIKEHLENNTPDLEKFTSVEKKKVIEEKYFNEYYKFMFVRNPYERLVSAYRNKIEFKTSGQRVSAGWIMEEWLKENISFSTFIERITHSEDILVANSHWRPYWKFKETFEHEFDFIGKVENFETDFSIVCNSIDIPAKNIPHKNMSLKGKKAWERRKKALKSNIPIAKPYHYSEYYTNETRNLVEKAYAQDLKDFNYSYENPNPI